MTCTDTFTAAPAPAPSLFGRVSQGFGLVLTRILELQERAEQRAQLANMDTRMRKDIGISYADAVCEAEKPFWRA